MVHHSILPETIHQQQIDHYTNPYISSSSTQKDIYPWMNEKKYGSNKNKNNTTSNSAGKIY